MLNRVNGVLNLSHIHRARAVVALPQKNLEMSPADRSLYTPSTLRALAGASPSIFYSPSIYALVRPIDRERVEEGLIGLILNNTCASELTVYGRT